MPCLRHEINTWLPHGEPNGNTSGPDNNGIAKCYLDVAVNSPHPVRDIGDFRIPQKLPAGNRRDGFILGYHEIDTFLTEIHRNCLVWPNNAHFAQ
ncbi:MAG: hypothetical protein ACJAUW_001349 [Yoonia sp.]|jgi:hypothetical protein